MLGSFRFCWSVAYLLVWLYRQLTENSVRLPRKVRPGHCGDLSGSSSSTQLCFPLIVVTTQPDEETLLTSWWTFETFYPDVHQEITPADEIKQWTAPLASHRPAGVIPDSRLRINPVCSFSSTAVSSRTFGTISESAGLASDQRLCFGRRLQFAWQRGENEVEFAVAIRLVDGCSAAPPQQPQLKVRLEHLQQVLVALKVCTHGTSERQIQSAEGNLRSWKMFFFLLFVCIPRKIFSALAV